VAVKQEVLHGEQTICIAGGQCGSKFQALYLAYQAHSTKPCNENLLILTQATSFHKGDAV